MIIRSEVKGLENVIKDLNTQNLARAVQRALNRAARGVKTDISSITREKFNIKKADLDRNIEIRFAAAGDTQAVLTVTGDPLLMTYFNPQQFGRGRRVRVRKGEMVTAGYTGKQSGVKVSIIRKGRPTVLKRSFIARGKGGTLMVFTRRSGTQTGRRGQPILNRKLIGRKVIAIPSMTQQKSAAIIARGTDRLQRELTHEIQYAFDKQTAAKS
jgi:hypothetical protein